MPSGSIYACFEESISEYSSHINNYNIKNWMWEQYGEKNRISGSISTGSADPVTPSLGPAITLSEKYGQMVNMGGNVDLKKGYITISGSNQDYDLQTKKLQQLTTPLPSSIKIGRVIPEIHPSTGQQYFVIEPDSGISGTVIFFHGGPTVPMRRRWDPIIASFLVNGFRVITPNPRGSLGRGPRFAGLDDGHLRLNIVENDIAPFLQSMEQRYENLFMYGGSYGGWLVLKIATSPCGSMIRAGATRNGIGDFNRFQNH